MTRTHVPVLAGELIELADPRPGDVVVDCTFGGGGHARLIADRIGSTGTLVCIDRDPAAEERFEEFAREVTCETRFLRMDYAEGIELLRAEGLEADLVYLDLGVSSMQVDTWERGFSYSYDAPLDMRMDPVAGARRARGREYVGRAASRQALPQLRRGALRRPDRARDRAQAHARATRDDLRPRGHDQVGGAGGHAVRARTSRQARVPGVRIGVNDELGALERGLPAAWDCCGRGAASPPSHSIRSRTGA